MKLVECIPNFSVGNDKKVIDEIAKEIISSTGVVLMDVDVGKSVNRTVMTFAGYPDSVINAAFKAVKRSMDLIDMTKHKGRHPRIGATDVCPLVPLKEISMQETVSHARRLALRIGEELKIPTFCYEEAAFRFNRRKLEDLRKGEYENIAQKIQTEEWKPDFGPVHFNPQTGVTAVGARNFLIAFNINLNTKDENKAKEIALSLRKARKKDIQLTAMKAIAWYLEDYDIVQISLNITDYNKTPLYYIYEKTASFAREHDISVTGSELIGMSPKAALLETGKYFANKEGIKDIDEDNIIKLAVDYLNLNDIRHFDPASKVIEYQLSDYVF